MNAIIAFWRENDKMLQLIPKCRKHKTLFERRWFRDKDKTIGNALLCPKCPAPKGYLVGGLKEVLKKK